ncbi:MAG: Nif11-like leader peptide family RiPP precursor [Cyanobacteria bacterium]|jgi:predicted ribosomally synthesized peptide with nif11-like leader|nr:Nif11-like leader peptide family RiPP precursor [Cyanobacteriota bacterium]
MALKQLDDFLKQARLDPNLTQQLSKPLDLEEFIELAAQAGYDLSEQDVLAAQARQEASLSDQELQQRAGEEARKLRSFIPG